MILPADRLCDCSPRHGNGYHSKMPMISFDVESLFTNVPIEETVQAALHRLNNDPSLPDRTALTPTQIADLLNFVPRSTYFKYNRALRATRRSTNGQPNFIVSCFPFPAQSHVLFLICPVVVAGIVVFQDEIHHPQDSEDC